MHAGFVSACTLAVLLASTQDARAAPRNWAGTNNYYVWALSASDRREHLAAMKSADMKVLRTFITGVPTNVKGGRNPAVQDLEAERVGAPYADDVLNRIDDLLTDCVEYGVKLTIALHDRYALGCWGVDGYVKKYGYPVAADCGKNPMQNNCSAFYSSPQAVADFDRRLVHVLTHVHPGFNKPWAQLDNAIFSFEPENEPQSYLPSSNLVNSWLCDRASLIKSYTKGSKILVTSGGFGPAADPLFSENVKCPSVDVMAVHSYAGAADLHRRLQNWIVSAHAHDKRIIVQEFGAQGASKVQGIDSYIETALGFSIPWQQWELSKPGGENALETWTGEPAWTTVMLPKARATANMTTGQEWPEIWG